jgi:hypothetical protein
MAFVKDENSNIGIMTISLQFIIDYEPLKPLWVYEGTYFGHVMSKTCQFATNDDKVYVCLNLANVKNV